MVLGSLSKQFTAGTRASAVFTAFVCLFSGCAQKEESAQRYQSRPAGSVTFHRDIAPIIYRQCTPCHQEGQPGPFNLASYQDVSKRAKQIVEVTESRFMPPWLPEKGHGDFLDARRLSEDEIGLIRQWAAEGAAEGDPGGSSAPSFVGSGWQLGQPDLVVEMPEAYSLVADGQDVYRNFVIPLAVRERRWVRAIEFLPRTKVIHHAFMMFDPTRQSRRLDAKSAEPGFGGVAAPPNVESPGGYFLSWQPGRRPVESPSGLAWALQPGQDLVLQMHMQPRGAVELVRPSIGFYFTDEAPTNTPVKISMSSYQIDIPAGARDHLVQDRFVLPADVHLLSVLPHAHFLARTIEGQANLPDGRKIPLLKINDWNFNWQSDYRYREPIFLPKGTELTMRITYDNSTNNVRNPNHPPVQVKYGLETRDEMGELWLQLLARTPEAFDAVQMAYQERLVKDAFQYNSLLIERDPTNAHAHVQLGKACFSLGDVERSRLLMEKGVALDPTEEEGHYNLGIIYMNRKQARSAAEAFTRTLRLNPENFRALNNLGLLYLRIGHLDDAERHFQQALRINPDDKIIQSNLKVLEDQRKKSAEN